MEGICVGCMSRMGLNRPLVAVALSFLPGSILPPYPIPWAFAAGTKSSLCAHGSWLEHTELWNCVWTMGFSFLALLFVLALTPLCFHSDSTRTLPTLPTFLLATGRVGRYCSDTSTICVTSSFLYWITASISHEKFQKSSDTFLCNSSLGCALNI